MRPVAEIAGISHLFVLTEAIHSVALEHPGDCDCTTCRAAAGDDEALGELLAELGGERP